MSSIFKFTEICREYPALYRATSSYYPIECYLTKSPFANCQSFAMGKAADTISLIDEKDIREFLFELYDLFGRKQLVIDICKNRTEKVLNKLRPYAKNIIETDYESTNGSYMVLCIVQIDPKKIVPEKQENK